jgi:hypothetical protein
MEYLAIGWQTFKDVRPFFSVVQSAFTIAALIAGLFWFIKRRERAPRANVEHRVNFASLDGGLVYVGVNVLIKNTGRVKVQPRVAQPIASLVVIEEVVPYLGEVQKSQEHSPEYILKSLGARTFPAKVLVEPSETHSILFEFIIQERTKVIKVYSHIDNSYNKGKGWDTTTIHEVKI